MRFLAAALLAFAFQDPPAGPGEQTYPEIVEGYRKSWEESRRDDVDRLKILHGLERLMLERFMEPMDEWIMLEGPAGEKLDRGPVWYLLKVRGADPIRGNDLWIKFFLDAKEIGYTKYLCTSCNAMHDRKETYGEYAKRKRNSLLDVLERHFVLQMHDEDSAYTIRTGNSHLYRLPTELTDPEKVRKEDLLQ